MADSDVVSQLEKAFLPLISSASEQLVSEYPEYEINIWSSPTGGLTSYQGHDVGIECMFPDAKPEESTCVAAEIGVWQLATNPGFNSYGLG